ncbi:MAG TPA: DUF4249 domain-containing protein [Puia sp.]|jgi:hypothetical protein|nr:DUF4249 domain-containing protein [Puia sp.]
MFRKPTILFSLFLLQLFFCTCVRRITPPIREGAQILVVEGLITTDSISYAVKLSYTGNFLNASSRIDSNQNFINDAKVVIKDDAGDSTLCNLISPGTYQTNDPNFVGIVGHTYSLEIYLSNGKNYVSTPEKINPVPPIDSISVVYDSTFITDIRPTQLIVSVNTHDPPGVQNFYRWTAYGYIPRKSWGASCSYPYPECGDPYSCSCFALCEQYITTNQLNVLSDKLVNGNEIMQPVFYSPIYWFGKHFIEVKQYSLNKDMYLFWQQYLQQTNRTGSILDPLPSLLVGNIHNASDSNDVALGYFETSAVVTKRVFIIPLFLQEYYLESVAGQYIADKFAARDGPTPGDCHFSYPNSLNDDADPTGWDNAQEIDLH